MPLTYQEISKELYEVGGGKLNGETRQKEIQVLSRQMWNEVKDHLPAVLYAGIGSESFPEIRKD